MSTSPLPPLDAELLLEHSQWMRRLARTLVASPERADDLAQETWRRILEAPPRLDQPFRGWIATVMRNLVRAERRGTARRTAREEQGARREAQPSSLELVERAALQRELVQAVLELEEPYRATILLRYFEDQSPSGIAAREHLPLATVKTRLARGLVRLRERLARTHGPDGRTSVLLALTRLELRPIPAAEPPWTAPLLTLPILMNVKLLAPVGLCAALALAYFLTSEDHGADGRARAAPAAQPDDVDLARLPSAPLPVAPPQREEAAARERASSQVHVRAAPASAGTLVRGRVIDAEGRGVGDVAVGLDPSERDGATSGADMVARSGPDGAFEFPGPRRGRLLAVDEHWTTLLAGVPVEERTGQECRIVVAARIALSGVVVDEEGAPLPGARVRLAPPADLRARLEQVLDHSAEVLFETDTDALGRFHFDPAPALADGALRIEKDGYATRSEPAPTVAHHDLVFVLARPGAGATILAGIVVDAGGTPVEEALVSFGIDSTETDADGRFAFRLDDPESFNHRAADFGLAIPDDCLRALKAGHLPAELRAPRAADGGVRWPAPLVLVLGAEPLAIQGRVLDEHGQGRAGIRVWLADPTFFGGRAEPSERFPVLAQAESLLAGAEPGWAFVETGAEGDFRLAGLLERDYRVAALDPATLLRTEAIDVAAGRHDVVLVLSDAALIRKLAGRVVDGSGAPVANLAVFPMCDVLETRLAGNLLGTQHETAPGTATDEAGRFELERVPENAVYLRLQGADTIPLEWGRGVAGGLARLAGDEPEELRLTVERRCHFQVQLALAAEADELGLLDSAGQALVISEFLGNGRNDTERHPLVDGRSSMLAASDRAATLVLYRAGFEVRRVAVRLTAGEPSQLSL